MIHGNPIWVVLAVFNTGIDFLLIARSHCISYILLSFQWMQNSTGDWIGESMSIVHLNSIVSILIGIKCFKKASLESFQHRNSLNIVSGTVQEKNPITLKENSMVNNYKSQLLHPCSSSSSLPMTPKRFLKLLFM